MPTSNPSASDVERRAAGGAVAGPAECPGPRESIPLPLQNRYVGILCDDADRLEPLLLQNVVTELGARTALVRPDLRDEAEPSAVDHASRLLGMLYDLVICVDLPARSIERMREGGHIPVIADLPLTEIVATGPSAEAVADLRRLIIARLPG